MNIGCILLNFYSFVIDGIILCGGPKTPPELIFYAKDNPKIHRRIKVECVNKMLKLKHLEFPRFDALEMRYGSV